MIDNRIPNSVLSALATLKQGGFSAYIVGGCVRDMLMNGTPKDWDITTDARPEQILSLFVGSKYENDFGTVLVPTGDELKCLEITTYRSEQGYTDSRHPDSIKFETELDKDLERRDFTINALAYDDEKIVDLFGGQKDIGKKIIRTVGEPLDRFKEDALRMLRAIRFSCVLGFKIEDKTWRGILKMAGSIKFISAERIRDELVKILASDKPYQGMMMLHEAKLLRYILPELEDGIDVKQSHHHVYTVFDHNLYSLEHCPSTEWQVRLAALLHDVGKPKSLKIISGEPTFYNHEYLGAKITERIVKRLKFSNEDGERIVNLVRNHMFYYNVGEVTAASVRRLLAKVGKENLRDLIAIRVSDRLI
jgi:poly(A) polymerase/tRNA nucleotidyltransferase (CCA-adding enzyme)